MSHVPGLQTPGWLDEASMADAGARCSEHETNLLILAQLRYLFGKVI